MRRRPKLIPKLTAVGGAVLLALELATWPAVNWLWVSVALVGLVGGTIVVIAGE